MPPMGRTPGRGEPIRRTLAKSGSLCGLRVVPACNSESVNPFRPMGAAAEVCEAAVPSPPHRETALSFWRGDSATPMSR